MLMGVVQVMNILQNYKFANLQLEDLSNTT
jgi:hypothetical protein